MNVNEPLKKHRESGTSLGVVSKRRPEAAGATSHFKRKIIFTAVQGTMPD